MVWIVDADLDKLEFADEGRFYRFPRDDKGRVVYCNVEVCACARAFSCPVHFLVTPLLRLSSGR